jgi:hypothetical protein
VVPTNRHHFVRILLASAVLLVVHAAMAARATPPALLTVLFLGTSYTSVNDLRPEGTLTTLSNHSPRSAEC